MKRGTAPEREEMRWRKDKETKVKGLCCSAVLALRETGRIVGLSQSPGRPCGSAAPWAILLGRGVLNPWGSSLSQASLWSKLTYFRVCPEALGLLESRGLGHRDARAGVVPGPSRHSCTVEVRLILAFTSRVAARRWGVNEARTHPPPREGLPWQEEGWLWHIGLCQPALCPTRAHLGASPRRSACFSNSVPWASIFLFKATTETPHVEEKEVPS